MVISQKVVQLKEFGYLKAGGSFIHLGYLITHDSLGISGYLGRID